MSSLPEGVRRLQKAEAKTEEDPHHDETQEDAEPGVRSVGQAPTKFSGIAAGDGLQRVGSQASGKYPVERRPGGSRAIQEQGPDEAPEAPDGPTPPLHASAPVRAAEAPATPAPGLTEAAGETTLASTGISGLDAQYGGGLPAGSLFLLTSDPTTATSIFAAQYAGAGLSEGEVVYYFSLEQPVQAVRSAIATFVKDEKDLERLRVIDGYPAQFANVPEDARRRIGLGKGDNALAALESLLVNPQLKGPVRIIVESITELMENNDPERVFRVLRVLRGVVQAIGGTAVVTLVEPLHDAKTVALAKHIADGVVEFHVERKGFGIYPYIAVTKMRGVTGSARLLLFKETESGLWLESTKRVF